MSTQALTEIEAMRLVEKDHTSRTYYDPWVSYGWRYMFWGGVCVCRSPIYKNKAEADAAHTKELS